MVLFKVVFILCVSVFVVGLVVFFGKGLCVIKLVIIVNMINNRILRLRYFKIFFIFKGSIVGVD